MTTVETGQSHFDVKTATTLDRNLVDDIGETYRMQNEMGIKFGEMIKVRAAELASLGIFPQQRVVAFEEGGIAKISMKPLISIGYRGLDPISLGNGYASVGICEVLGPDGEITHRRVFDKGGTSIVGNSGSPATPNELCKIGPEALQKIYDVNVEALQDPKNHR